MHKHEYYTFNPEVGPDVVSFDLNDSSKAKITIIFVKESAWKEAAEIAQNNNAAPIAPYDLIYQLRQLRTRFHQQSTYFLCRTSNETALFEIAKSAISVTLRVI
ncbi:unnamed protein product [Rhizopus stolonifer]